MNRQTKSSYLIVNRNKIRKHNLHQRTHEFVFLGGGWLFDGLRNLKGIEIQRIMTFTYNNFERKKIPGSNDLRKIRELVDFYDERAKL